MITATQWLRVLGQCGVRFATAVTWSAVFEARVQPDGFSAGVRELDDFVGQVLYETELLESLEEDLHYSAKRIVQVWPRRFPTLSAAAPYAMRPQALANKTYGGRMGNVKVGDGWLFRGRGIPMITGRANYALLAELTGLPLLVEPWMLQDPDAALRCAVLWWEKRIPDTAIDSVERVTRCVQGGSLGLAERKVLSSKASLALFAFGVTEP